MLHGFTGNPSSMRGLAETLAADGLHVELPRLPGHGTTIEDMLTTGWADWTGEVEAAYQRLAARAGKVVVAGLSMGGSLALWAGLQHPDVAGLVLVNPATKPQPPEVMTMLADMLAAGTEVAPGHRQRHRRPRGAARAPTRLPAAPADRPSSRTGWRRWPERYGELTMPLLLFTSRQDHVVEPTQSEYLVEQYGGPVDHRWLERSYHVATMDFDRDVISVEAATFAKQVTGS